MPDFGDGADKWAHVMMYLGTCSVMWWEYFRNHERVHYGRVFAFAIVFPIAMSGIIELVQEFLTTNRSGDIFDFVANSVGVVFASMVAFVCKFMHFYKNNKSK